ncbi:MAG: hypothetical protein KIPDCIKN_01187 [Haliscomenobacter sp.]|nr:hypothetical protein [Haliscomenobacter sp.]
MIVSRIAEAKARQLLGSFKSLAIMGPRQSGKTTLARHCFPEKPYVSLENPVYRNFALTDPQGFLAQYPQGAILDEIQRAPELLSFLQQKLDEGEGKFVLTGSNNLLLLDQITQTLAGRVAYLELLPFSVEETEAASGSKAVDRLLLEGSYPSVQAEGVAPQDWFLAYVRTYVERDVRQIRNIDNLLLFERFLSLCAGRVGQQVNFSNLATETGIDLKTAQGWLGILQASYILFLLPPYYQNFNKRVTKSPKLYFYDTGLAAFLLGIRRPDELALHPYRGPLFENWILLELIKNRFNRGERSNLYYWKDASCEIDALIANGSGVTPVEIKSGQTIHADYFKCLHYWNRLTGHPGGLVFYAGTEKQIRSNEIAVLPWREVREW